MSDVHEHLSKVIRPEALTLIGTRNLCLSCFAFVALWGSPLNAEKASCTDILSRASVSDPLKVVERLEESRNRMAKELSQPSRVFVPLANPEELDEALSMGFGFKELRLPGAKQVLGVNENILASMARIETLLSWARAHSNQAQFQMVDAELRTSSNARLAKPGWRGFARLKMPALVVGLLMTYSKTRGLGVLLGLPTLAMVIQMAYYQFRHADEDVFRSDEFEREMRRVMGHAKVGEWIHMGLSQNHQCSQRPDLSAALKALQRGSPFEDGSRICLLENSLLVNKARADLMRSLISQYGLGHVYLDVFLEKVRITRMRLTVLISVI